MSAYGFLFIIIPFFNKYPIVGIKSLDFLDFKKVSSAPREIILKKEHLTNEGLISIKNIKKGMNNSRLNKD